tara:strand:- start:1030 stop:1257 length:228 start_codon:yes stop_codon:yes gene_type:complete
MRDVIDGWLVRHWPILVVAAGGIAWGVRLEERMGHHLTQPYHSEMRETRDSLIEIKAELRYLREDVLELKKKMEP